MRTVAGVDIGRAVRRLLRNDAFDSALLTAAAHHGAAPFAWLADLRSDSRQAPRVLRRNPVYALTAIVSLAIGIGGNTTVFTVADAVLFHDPRGVAAPDRLVDIGSSRDGDGFGTISFPTYLDVLERSRTLEGVYVHPMFPQAMSLAEPSTPPLHPSNRFLAASSASTTSRYSARRRHSASCFVERAAT